jgi:hypothetical protein
MAIGTYAQLKSAVETWLSRQGDSDITGNAGDFVSLAGARLNRDLPLRMMQTTTTLTGTASSRELALPTDYIEPYALHLTTSGQEAVLKPEVAGNFLYGTIAGTPTAWCINGANIDLDVPCDQAHTFSFRYRKTFTLSDSETTNWLLTNHPDCYLAAVMVEACVFADDPRASGWEQRLQAAIASIAETDARSVAVATLNVDPVLVGRGRFDYTTGRSWP